MTARPALPSTTAHAHPREDLHRFVNQLNVLYNLGIPIPDPNLTQTEKRQDQSLESRIYRRLEIHFFTGGIEDLKGFLRQFDTRAKTYWSNWVHKPKADADTLPATKTPPLAANITERKWLQNIFNEVLDTAQPTMQSSRSLGRSQSGPAAMGRDAVPGAASPANSRTSSKAPSRPAPKRRADAELGDLVKKTRADADPIRALTASSSLRRRQGSDAIASASTSGAMGPPRTTPVGVGSARIFRSFATATTVTSAASVVFSESGNAPDGTQDTILASTQEQLRPPFINESDKCSQDSYGFTSSLEAGLCKSFGQGQASSGARTSKCSSKVSLTTTQSSDFGSSMPSDVAEEASRRTSGLEAQSQVDDHGLSNIWRMFVSIHPLPLYRIIH